MAEALTWSGRPVVVLDLDGQLHAVAEQLRAEGTQVHALIADVNDAASVRAAVNEAERELGPIEVLANVAGVLRTGPVLELDDGDWARCIAVNATGVWHVGRTIGRLMYERGGGTIVTVASRHPQLLD